MTTMKAALYDGIHTISIHDVERPTPPPGHVLLRTQRTGICGSDLHNYNGHGNPPADLARGHETCGVITELGEGVTSLQVGDRAAIEVLWYCGECVQCRTGRYNLCPHRRPFTGNHHGAFAEYTIAPAKLVFPVPTHLSDEQGALVEPLSVAYRAVALSGATYQDRVAVIGGGTIGMLSMAAAVAAGVRDTLITVKYPQQAKIATELGAGRVVNISEENAAEAIHDWSDGSGADVVIETVGGGSNFDVALSAVRSAGTVVLVAIYNEPVTVDLNIVVVKEANVIGSLCCSYTDTVRDFQAAIDLIATNRVDVAKLVTHRFPLDEIAEAFVTAADKRSGALKVHLISNVNSS